MKKQIDVNGGVFPMPVLLISTFVEEVNLKGGVIDIDSLNAIAFDPYTHGYYKVGGRVGEAFKDGLKLK